MCEYMCTSKEPNVGNTWHNEKIRWKIDEDPKKIQSLSNISEVILVFSVSTDNRQGINMEASVITLKWPTLNE